MFTKLLQASVTLLVCSYDIYLRWNIFIEAMLYLSSFNLQMVGKKNGAARALICQNI